MARQYKQLDQSSQYFKALANNQQQGGRLIVAKRAWRHQAMKRMREEP
jgi:hypothetical protein